MSEARLRESCCVSFLQDLRCAVDIVDIQSSSVVRCRFLYFLPLGFVRVPVVEADSELLDGVCVSMAHAMAGPRLRVENNQSEECDFGCVGGERWVVGRSFLSLLLVVGAARLCCVKHG